jgi:DNA-binding NarL/FixJ family response regulator
MPVGVGAQVSPVVVRVLLLYSHPLMGEGLGRMLETEPGLSIEAVDVSAPGAVDAALAAEPDVIIVEEGGAVDAADVVRRSTCSVVLDVDINTTNAWTLSREMLPTRPDDFLASLRSVVARVIDRGGGSDADCGATRAVVSG